MGAIRAVLLTPGLWQPGGAERWIYSLIANSDPRHLEWLAVVLGGYGGADVELTRSIARHCKVYGEHPSVHRDPEAVRLMDTAYVSLVDALKKACERADVLVTWGSPMLGRFMQNTNIKIPVVYASHCSTPWPHAVDGITHLVGVSEMSMNHFDGNAGFDGLPRAVILNGVEVERCVPRQGREWQRNQWGVGPHDVLVGHIGRQSPTKKSEVLISTIRVLESRAWESIDGVRSRKTGLPRYKAVFVGADVQTQAPAKYLLEMARSQIPDDAIFIPTVSGIGDILAGLDCVFSASPAEANSLVVLEAFLGGVPVVSTPVGAIPELTRQKGDLAFQIADPANFEEMADLIILATDRDCRARNEQVLRARQIAWDEWTAPAMAQRWTDYLATVIRRPLYKQMELFRQW